MTNAGSNDNNLGVSRLDSSRFGYYSAILTAIIPVVTFGFALTAIPISGANCLGDCVEYPYSDTVSRYPKDF